MRSNNDNVELANKDTEQYIIHAVGRVFVKGVFITSVCQEIMSNAHFVKQRERAKQKRKKLKRC